MMCHAFPVLVGLLALVTASVVPSAAADSQALPFPELAPEEIQVPDWDPERPLPHSVLAWHHCPAMVRPLLEVGSAVDDSTLSIRTRRMLAAIVASRNECRY